MTDTKVKKRGRPKKIDKDELILVEKEKLNYVLELVSENKIIIATRIIDELARK